MKFWERFLRNIYKFSAIPRLKELNPKLLEAVLAKSPLMLDDEMVKEINTFIVSHQTAEGGFADRGGKTDLYYTLFGFYISEALTVSEVFEPLKNYVKEVVTKNSLSGVHRYCGAILYTRLFGLDSVTENLRRQIVIELKNASYKQPEYSGFLGILALYYLQDYITIRKVVKQYKHSNHSTGTHPCPVVAANAIILSMANSRSPERVNELRSFHRKNGGFAALKRAPSDDLLSTGVALFALNFLDADVRLIKPDCLNFVDDMYDNGGFRSTYADSITDIEYTFYGLLALGSMS